MIDFSRWPHAHQFERSQGLLKHQNADFKVTEKLPEEPSGEGEHLWLTVEKDGQNTAWVARQLARWANVNPRNVSYAGLKDRHALTRQTFSIHLPGLATPDIDSIQIEGLSVIQSCRHTKKLKTGQLIGNQFTIRIRDCNQTISTLAQHWQQLVDVGVPNYFGPQRFGRNGQNFEKAKDWLIGKQKAQRSVQSIYLSAIRSFLFNELLAQRIEQGNWNTVLAGDFVQFTEGRTGFYVETLEDDIVDRCTNGVLSPCISLPGANRETFLELDQRERSQLEDYADLLVALENRKVMRQFRKTRVFPENASFTEIEGDPVFSFFLPAGCYATTILAEMFNFEAHEEVVECHE